MRNKTKQKTSKLLPNCYFNGTNCYSGPLGPLTHRAPALPRATLGYSGPSLTEHRHFREAPHKVFLLLKLKGVYYHEA